MVAGVVFSFFAAIVLNTGNIVQKHAISALPTVSAARSAHLLRTLLSSRRWLFGLTLCIVGVIMQIMAFSLAPIPVVQSIFNAGLVLLLVLSRLRIGERFSRSEWVGLTVVVLALIALGASLSGTNTTVGVASSGWPVLAASVPTFLVAALVVAGVRSGRGQAAILYGIAAGLLYGAATLGTKGASTLVVDHGVTASVPAILTSVYPYVFLVFSLAGMVVYQSGIQRFRIAVVGSMSDVVASTYVVVVGMAVFGEHLPHNPTILALRLAGFAGVLVGSVLVALGGGAPAEEMPIVEGDLGLGAVLVAEADSLIGHNSGGSRSASEPGPIIDER